MRINTSGLAYSPCQRNRAGIVEILSLAVFYCQLCAGSHAAIILHALHDFQRTGRKDVFVFQQLAPIFNGKAGVKVCAIPTGGIRSGIFLRVIPADVKTDIDSQRLQLRIGIASIGQLRLEEIHQLGVLFKGRTNLVIEF